MNHIHTPLFRLPVLLLGFFLSSHVFLFGSDRKKVFEIVQEALEVTDQTEFLYVSSFPGDIKKILETFHEWSQWFAGEEQENGAFEVDWVGLGTLLGLDRLAGVGYSSRGNQEDGAAYHNRTIYQFTGEPTGLFSLFSQESMAFELAQKLPEDTAFSIELRVDLDTVYQSVEEIFETLGFADVLEEFDWFLDDPILPIVDEVVPPRWRQILMDSPVTLALAFIHHSSGERQAMGFPFSGTTMPIYEVYFTINSEGFANFDWGAMLAEWYDQGMIESYFDKDGVWTVSLFEELVGENVQYAPVVKIDSASGQFSVWTTEGLRESMSKGKKSLSNSASYLQATRNLPSEGHFNIYVARELLAELANFYTEILEIDAAENDLFHTRGLLDALADSTSGVAWAGGRYGEQWQRVGNNFLSHQGKTLTLLAGPPALIATALIQPIKEVRTSARHTAVLSNLRQIGIAVQMHWIEQNRDATMGDVEVMLEGPVVPVMGEEYPDFKFKSEGGWIYEIQTPDGTRFFLDPSGRVWKD